MPRTATRKRKTEDEEVDDILDELDEDEELEDEDEEVEDDELEDDEDVEEEDDDEEPDEAPRAKRSRTKKTASKKKAAAKDGIGTAELAAEAGVSSRELRMFLRDQNIQANREGRYNWPSVDSREAQMIIKKIKGGAVSKLRKEQLDKVKARGTAKRATAKKSTAKRTTSRKSTTTKKRAAARS